MRIKRRRFLTTVTATLSGGLSGCSVQKRTWRFFTESEMETVRAVADCIIPPDDFPGGAEAGVPIFLDRQLSKHYRKYQELYREGLSALDRAAVESSGKRFHQLERNEQTLLLRAIEKGETPAGWGARCDARRFFLTVLAHTHQGFYGDPRHGGNRGQVGYLMLGVPATNVRGRSQHDSRLIPISGVSPTGGKR